MSELTEIPCCSGTRGQNQVYGSAAYAQFVTGVEWQCLWRVNSHVQLSEEADNMR